MGLIRSITLALAIFVLFYIASLKPVSAGVWIENEIISEEASSPEISIASDGFARVVLMKSAQALDYLKCTNMTCTSYTRTDLGFTNNANLDTHAIVEGSDNYSKIVATSSTTGMWLISCLNADCSSRSTTLLDGTATNPREVEVRKAPDGFLRIFYEKISPYSLNYIQCTDSDCGTKNSTQVITTESFFGDAQMDIDSDGFAHIVYGDYGSLGYKYLRCTNTNCSTFTTSPIHEGDFEEPSSLRMVLGTDNFARIVYISGLTGSLSIIVCENSTCSTNTETTLVANYSAHFTIARDSNNYIHTTVIVTDSEGDVGERRVVSCANSLCTAYDSTVIYSNTMANSDTIAFDDLNNGYIPFSDDLLHLHFATKTPDPTPTPTATPTPTQTPTPTPGQPGPQASIMGSTTETPTCNNPAPSHAPDLFQAVVRPQSALLYFSPIAGIHTYFLAFGRSPGSEEYGGELSYGDVSGVLAYQIEHLQPGTTYYLKIRGSNGCMPGDWSNMLTITTPRSGSKLVYKDLVSQVLSAFTNSSATASVPSTLGASTKSKKPSSCNYTVKPGENLWDIASQLLGNGTLYQKIIQLNKLPTDALNPGQKLKVC